MLNPEKRAGQKLLKPMINADEKQRYLTNIVCGPVTRLCRFGELGVCLCTALGE